MSRAGTKWFVWLSSVVLMAAGCGGACPQAAGAAAFETSTTAPPAPSANAESAALPESGSADHVEAGEKAPEKMSGEPPSKPSAKPEEVAPEPTFPENASVAEATRAVPQGTSRANIDPQRLGEPLQSSSIYEPCKVGEQHFKLRVAVWNGHAVGVDVVTPNKKLAACIDQQVRSLAWPDKVRSLNTVDFAM